MQAMSMVSFDITMNKQTAAKQLDPLQQMLHSTK